METLNISNKTLKTLKEIPIPNEVYNTEAKLYYLKTGKKSLDDENLLLKKIYIPRGNAMANKLFTVSMLNDHEREMNIKELVIPKHLVSNKGEIIGFTVKNIEATSNLGLTLHNKKVTTKEKIELLKLLGNLLKKTTELEKSNLHFYFNDLHEYNFLLDKDKNLYAVDLDSVAMNDNYPLTSTYPIRSKILRNLDGKKYKANEYGIYYPSHNLDLFSYSMIILNTISNYDISRIDINEYYNYISYLESLGYGKNITRAMLKLFTNSDNENPVDYFDEMPEEMLERSSYNVYSYLKRKEKFR